MAWGMVELFPADALHALLAVSPGSTTWRSHLRSGNCGTRWAARGRWPTQRQEKADGGHLAGRPARSRPAVRGPPCASTPRATRKRAGVAPRRLGAKGVSADRHVQLRRFLRCWKATVRGSAGTRLTRTRSANRRRVTAGAQCDDCRESARVHAPRLIPRRPAARRGPGAPVRPRRAVQPPSRAADVLHHQMPRGPTPKERGSGGAARSPAPMAPRPCTPTAPALVPCCRPPPPQHHRYRMIAYGQWQPFTDAGPGPGACPFPATQGLGAAGFAEAFAGVAAPAVPSLLYGRAGRRRRGRSARPPPGARVPARPGRPAPRTQFDATGARRRMQALAAAGWSAQRLANHLAVDRAHAGRIIRGDNPRVTAATARTVRGLSDELWDRPPPQGTRWEKVAASAPRNRAPSWAGLRRWHGMTAGMGRTRAAQPAAGWRERGEERRWGMLADEAHELFGFGLDPAAGSGTPRGDGGCPVRRPQARVRKREEAA